MSTSNKSGRRHRTCSMSLFGNDIIINFFHLSYVQTPESKEDTPMRQVFWCMQRIGLQDALLPHIPGASKSQTRAQYLVPDGKSSITHSGQAEFPGGKMSGHFSKMLHSGAQCTICPGYALNCDVYFITEAECLIRVTIWSGDVQDLALLQGRGLGFF